MTKHVFLNRVANGQTDIIQVFLDLLRTRNIAYCVIGGLAVNAYVEPVVSLDLDIVVTAEAINIVIETVQPLFTVTRFPHSINLNHPQSDLRIQLQNDSRYQPFVDHASNRDVMGYTMRVADVKDVLQGKIWAYQDQARRKSKRQKDLADIFRLVEAFPELQEMLPETIRQLL